MFSMLNQEQQGKAVASARAWTGMNQETFAAAISDKLGRSVSAFVISTIESGQRAVKLDEIVVMAELSGFPQSFFAYGPGYNPPGGNVAAMPGYRRSLRVISPKAA